MVILSTWFSLPSHPSSTPWLFLLPHCTYPLVILPFCVCLWTLFSCPHCSCPSSAFITKSQGPAFHSWSLFKPNLHLLFPVLPSWNNKWKKAKIGECFTHLRAWKCRIKIIYPPLQSHRLAFFWLQSFLPPSCLPHAPSVTTTVTFSPFLQTSHALLKFCEPLNREIHLLEGPLLPSLPGKHLLIFQRFWNVTSSPQFSQAESGDSGIYHSVWHSVFISMSPTGS